MIGNGFSIYDVVSSVFVRRQSKGKFKTGFEEDGECLQKTAFQHEVYQGRRHKGAYFTT